MNRKLLILPLTAAIIFALYACTPNKPAPPDSTPPIVEPTPPKDIYDRAGIIAGNKTISSVDFKLTSAWATEWAAAQYDASLSPTVAAQEDFGVYLSPVLHSFGGDLAFYRWNVTVTLSDGTEDAIPVQTLFYTKDGSMYLSGILANENIIETQEAAYAYFKTDSRLSAQMKPYPISSFSANITEIRGFGTSSAGLENMYLLGESTLASIFSSFEHGAEDGSAVYTISLMDISTGSTFKTIEFITLKVKRTYMSGETLILEYVDSLDNVSIVRHEISPSGSQNKVLTTDKLGEHTMPGGARIVEEDASLHWLNPATSKKKLLLQGVNTQDDSLETYKMPFFVDETRIAYVNQGWEWIVSCGIYDVSAASNHPIVPPTGVEDLYPIKAVGNTLYCSGFVAGAVNKSAVFTATDLTTYETKQILPQITDFNMAALSPDATKAAYMLTENNQTTVSIYDIASGTLLSDAQVYSPFEALSNIQFVNNETLQLWGHAYIGTSPLIYKLSLPKGAQNAS